MPDDASRLVTVALVQSQAEGGKEANVAKGVARIGEAAAADLVCGLGGIHCVTRQQAE